MGRLRLTHRRTLALLLATAAIAGCGNEARQTTTDAPSARNAALVTCTRSGGFAGVTERVDVRADGWARITTGAGRRQRSARYLLTDVELNRLVKALADAHFAGLQPLYGHEPPPPDTFERTVTSGPTVVRVLYGGRPPAGLARVLAQCDGLVRAHGPR